MQLVHGDDLLHAAKDVDQCDRQLLPRQRILGRAWDDVDMRGGGHAYGHDIDFNISANDFNISAKRTILLAAAGRHRASYSGQYLDDLGVEIIGSGPFDETHMLADAVAENLVEDIVFAGRDRRSAEPLSQLQVLAIRAALPAADRQLGVTR